MARSKQTSRKSTGGKAPRKQQAATHIASTGSRQQANAEAGPSRPSQAATATVVEQPVAHNTRARARDSAGANGSVNGNNGNSRDSATLLNAETTPSPQSATLPSLREQLQQFAPISYQRQEGDSPEEWSIDEVKLLLGVQATLSEFHANEYLDYPALRVRGKNSIVRKLREIYEQALDAADAGVIGMTQTTNATEQSADDFIEISD